MKISLKRSRIDSHWYTDALFKKEVTDFEIGFFD